MLLDDTYPLSNDRYHHKSGSLSDKIEQAYDQATSLEVPRFKMAGLARKPSDMLNFLRSHGARARRHTMPKSRLSIECFGPSGRSAVELTFGDS